MPCQEERSLTFAPKTVLAGDVVLALDTSCPLTVARLREECERAGASLRLGGVQLPAQDPDGALLAALRPVLRPSYP